MLPTLVATIGSLMATEAIKIIAGVGDPLIGRAIVVDALGATFREVAYERAEFVDRDPFDGAGLGAAQPSGRTRRSRSSTSPAQPRPPRGHHERRTRRGDGRPQRRES